MEKPEGLLVQLVQNLMCLGCAHLAEEGHRINGQMLVEVLYSRATSFVPII